MSSQLIENIIKEVIQEQVEIFRQVQDFDKRFPWFSEVMMKLSERIVNSETQVKMDDLGDGYFNVSFIGPADVLLAIDMAMDGRYVSAKHHKSQEGQENSTLGVLLKVEEEVPVD